jgi:HK97 family phage prohead protease
MQETKDRQEIATKTFRAEVKAEAPAEGATTGTFDARVAAFDNVDLQGDRIDPAAFDATKAAWEESGDPVPVIWSHQWDDPMAHIGSVNPGDLTVDADGLNVHGVIDLGTPIGAQVHKLMVERRVKEFSFAYMPTDAVPDPDNPDVRLLKGLDLFEVGPTLKGANPATELFGAKSALARHTSTTDDGSWDAAVAESRLPNSATALAAAHAWRDPDGDPEAKASYKFPHHLVAEDGRVGAASLLGASGIIGALNGARGGASIPDADRQGVYDHAAGHLTDGEREAPPLKSLDELDEVDAALENANDHGDGSGDDGGPATVEERALRLLEAKYGRVLSKANENRLGQARDLIDEVLGSLGTAADDEASGPKGSGADRGAGRARDTAEAVVHLLEAGGPL